MRLNLQIRYKLLKSQNFPHFHF
uniref:Uncharacterized protein n=1 Tax=Anguilla anguilla TaxID=7936 RepID=A0A0E9V0Z2_ANGAN